MMTPKQKAEDLFNKFNAATVAYDSGDHTAEGIDNSIMVMVAEAKRCATIAVDEVIDVIYKIVMLTSEKMEYWKQVKKEIENL